MARIAAARGPQRDQKKDENAEDWKVGALLHTYVCLPVTALGHLRVMSVMSFCVTSRTRAFAKVS